MVLPHSCVMRLKQVNTNTTHLMVSGRSKCSKHVSCCSADQPARSLLSHLRRLLSRDQPLSQLALPVASGQFFSFFLSFFFYSKIWFFPKLVLPRRAVAMGTSKGSLDLGEERGCGLKPRNPSSGPATMLTPRTDANSGARGRSLGSRSCPALPPPSSTTFSETESGILNTIVFLWG